MPTSHDRLAFDEWILKVLKMGEEAPALRLFSPRVFSHSSSSDKSPKMAIAYRVWMFHRGISNWANAGEETLVSYSRSGQTNHSRSGHKDRLLSWSNSNCRVSETKNEILFIFLFFCSRLFRSKCSTGPNLIVLGGYHRIRRGAYRGRPSPPEWWGFQKILGGRGAL